jgi:hypothetical protein
MEGYGSINFAKCGGIICCNFNPFQSYCWQPEYFKESDGVLYFGEDPGPGLCMTLPVILGSVCILSQSPCIIAFPDYHKQFSLSKIYCCCGMCGLVNVMFPLYCCFGLCGPVNFRGITFSVVDDKVHGKISIKHCCTEERPIILTDVLDIRVVESHRVLIPGRDKGQGN